jgi:glycosyltransferase involved in cell wall biosynthesis
LAKGLLRAGHEVRVLAVDRGPGAELLEGCERHERIEEVETFFYPKHWFKWQGFGLGWERILARACEHRPDVVHAYQVVTAGYLGVACARHLGVPAVVSCRGNDITKGVVQQPELVKWVLDQADAVTTVASSLIGYAGLVTDVSKVVPVWNSIEGSFAQELPPRVDLRRRLGIAEHVPLLGANASFRWKKGTDYLAALLEQLVSAGVGPFHFLLCGSFEPELEQRLRSLLEPTRIHGEPALTAIRRPSRGDLPAILGALDLFVSTSRREGMPNSLLEAMACGTPIAATAVDGCVELLEATGAGVLLDPFDPRAGAAAVARLLRSPEELARLAEQGRRATRGQFSIAREVGEIEAIYASVVGRTAVAGSAALPSLVLDA